MNPSNSTSRHLPAGIQPADDRLIELDKTELEKIGLARAADVADGCVIPQAKACPVYAGNYALHVE